MIICITEKEKVKVCFKEKKVKLYFKCFIDEKKNNLGFMIQKLKNN